MIKQSCDTTAYTTIYIFLASSPFQNATCEPLVGRRIAGVLVLRIRDQVQRQGEELTSCLAVSALRYVQPAQYTPGLKDAVRGSHAAALQPGRHSQC